MSIVYRSLTLALCIGISALAMSCSFGPKFKKYRIDLPVFYLDKSAAQSVDLMKGKHIVGFFNPDCKHCRDAALAMHEFRKKHQEMSFFMFIYCVHNNAIDSLALSDFWKISQANDVPNACLDFKTFLDSTGGAFPQILWVNDGWVEKNTSNNPLNEHDIEKWMKQ